MAKKSSKLSQGTVKIFIGRKWHTILSTDSKMACAFSCQLLTYYNIIKAKKIVFIYGMQDCSESVFGKIPTGFNKHIKWNSSDKLIDQYFNKARNVFSYMSGRLEDIIQNKEYSRVIHHLVKSRCLAGANVSLKTIVEGLDGMSCKNICLPTIDTIKRWFACIDDKEYGNDRPPYQVVMEEIGAADANTFKSKVNGGDILLKDDWNFPSRVGQKRNCDGELVSESVVLHRPSDTVFTRLVQTDGFEPSKSPSFEVASHIAAKETEKVDDAPRSPSMPALDRAHRVPCSDPMKRSRSLEMPEISRSPNFSPNSFSAPNMGESSILESLFGKKRVKKHRRKGISSYGKKRVKKHRRKGISSYGKKRRHRRKGISSYGKKRRHRRKGLSSFGRFLKYLRRSSFGRPNDPTGMGAGRLAPLTGYVSPMRMSMAEKTTGMTDKGYLSHIRSMTGSPMGTSYPISSGNNYYGTYSLGDSLNPKYGRRRSHRRKSRKCKKQGKKHRRRRHSKKTPSLFGRGFFF